VRTSVEPLNEKPFHRLIGTGGVVDLRKQYPGPTKTLDTGMDWRWQRLLSGSPITARR